ncbi:hypothetical protein [Deinococcus aquaticus]|uniref:hypothetical protein n=1 Tax=Deinococcus aquaticus TaxID=328692 RepID=UPI003F46E19F
MFDSSSRPNDFLTSATLADRVVLCTRAGDNLDFTLPQERHLLAAAGVDVHGPNFGIMVTGMPDGDPERSIEDELEWLEERRGLQALFNDWLINLGRRGLPVLGVVTYREVHRLATLTRPRDFHDHHRVLGSFLGVSHLLPPPVPADYLDQLRTQRPCLSDMLQILRR